MQEEDKADDEDEDREDEPDAVTMDDDWWESEAEDEY
jgi:hypothetical protein